MHQYQERFSVETRGKGLYDCTDQVRSGLSRSGVQVGLAVIFIQHTSASLLIQENADPEVLRDLERFFTRLVPDGDALFRHVEEGPDDMPGHVRAALTQTSLHIPVSTGRLALGTYQGVFLYEHRERPHQRSCLLHVLGE